jgi:hypothetical protein
VCFVLSETTQDTSARGEISQFLAENEIKQSFDKTKLVSMIKRNRHKERRDIFSMSRLFICETSAELLLS